jgi:hypothetical protein
MTSTFTSFADLDDGLAAADVGQAFDIRANAHIANGGEQAAHDCPKCNGRGHVTIGYRYTRQASCFGCNGTGKLTNRQFGAVKAKATRENNFFAWLGEHSELVATLRGMSGWNSFAQQMVAIVDDEKRSLTENQVAACRRMLAKVEAARDAKRAERNAEQAAKSGAVNISAIAALFAQATDNDIKRPIFRAEALEISKASPTGKNAGALYVKSHDDLYLGKIVGGTFHASREAPADTLTKLQAVAVDPTAEAIKYARRTGRCGCCGKGLVDPVSIRAGIGPICAENWGLDFRREMARDELAAEKEQEAAA